MNDADQITIKTHERTDAHVAAFTKLLSRYDYWKDGLLNLLINDEFNGPIVCVSVPDAIHLRDWLTNAINTAGPRPLHPFLQGMRCKWDPYADDLAVLSDRLYELDRLKAGAE